MTNNYSGTRGMTEILFLGKWCHKYYVRFEHIEMSMIKFSYMYFLLKIDADPENWPER